MTAVSRAYVIASATRDLVFTVASQNNVVAITYKNDVITTDACVCAEDVTYDARSCGAIKGCFAIVANNHVIATQCRDLIITVAT